jgi:hypothetical protein
MTADEKTRLSGILKTLSGTFHWELCYTDWDGYLNILDDLEFDEVKEMFLHYSKNSLRFPDPIAIRNAILLERKMKLAGLAAHN